MFYDTPALSAYDHFSVMVFAQLAYREALRDFLNRCAITISTMSVSSFRALIATLRESGAAFTPMRAISVGAEPLSLNDLALFRRYFSADCSMQNALATTETRTIAQVYFAATGPMPEHMSVGLPVDGKSITLRDAEGHVVPAGVHALPFVPAHAGWAFSSSWRRCSHLWTLVAWIDAISLLQVPADDAVNGGYTVSRTDPRSNNCPFRRCVDACRRRIAVRRGRMKGSRLESCHPLKHQDAARIRA